jgi:N-acyl-D-aspartate/D-glutamate deacylase
MHDILIRGAVIVDGSGGPPIAGDVAITNGRIGDIGSVTGLSRRVIEADGLVVCPGFIDVHTHYDAQLLWDGTASPSNLHGVTTVIGGNCGFGLAPVDASSAAYLLPMLARVEGMPLESLEAGLDMEWTTFASYLSRLEGRIAVNAGFFVGHSTLRRFVMGERAQSFVTTPDDLRLMCDELRRAIEGGALGLSSSWSEAHNDQSGMPVPSRYAAAEELLKLAAVVGELPGTALEFIPTIKAAFDLDTVELMAQMSVDANRLLNWNLLGVRPGADETQSRAQKLAASDFATAMGGRVVALTLPEPMRMRLSLYTGVLFDALPNWAELFRMRVAERLVALQDPVVRRRLAQGAKEDGRAWLNWAEYRVADVGDSRFSNLVGRRIGDISVDRSVTPFDTLLDIAIADDLQTGFEAPLVGDDQQTWRDRLELWRDNRTLVGGSDAGAHLDMMQTFALTTRLLGEAVRDRALLPLEEAVALLTDHPSRLFGLAGRGRLSAGNFADVVVFDPATIGPGQASFRYDLPGGGGRLYAGANGIHHVLVNGVETVSHGVDTGLRPGSVLRSGVDTKTVYATAPSTATRA